MRFMVLVKADKNTEAGALPDEKLLTEMGSSTKSWPKRACCWRERGSIQAQRVRAFISRERSGP